MQINRTFLLESVAQFTDSVQEFARWDDVPAGVLIASQRSLAGLARTVQTLAAQAAAEIAHRSRPELGHQGLSYTEGFHSPKAMVQSLTGSTAGDASLLVTEGLRITEDAAAFELEEAVERGDLPSDSLLPSTWETPITRAENEGTLSLEKAAVIRRALAPATGRPITELDPDSVADAVARLLEAASTLHVDALFAEARFERDRIDTEGIAEREEQRRERRYLKWHLQGDGMTRLHGLLDPESAAMVIPVLQDMTSPRRGGPRFVDDADKERAQRILDDPRSNEQLWLDGLTDLVRVAINCDPIRVVGPARPMVKILVTERSLIDGHGFGMIEGQDDAVGLTTVERALCEGFQPIGFDEEDATCINVGRDRRLFTGRQRDALAVRDGGCMMPGCDRSAVWTEAHHIDPWSQEGKTNLADGILLCRSDHLRLHNQGNRILRRGTSYFLRLKASPDDGSDDILLRTKNRLRQHPPGLRAG